VQRRPRHSLFLLFIDLGLDRNPAQRLFEHGDNAVAGLDHRNQFPPRRPELVERQLDFRLIQEGVAEQPFLFQLV